MRLRSCNPEPFKETEVKADIFERSYHGSPIEFRSCCDTPRRASRSEIQRFGKTTVTIVSDPTCANSFIVMQDAKISFKIVKKENSKRCWTLQGVDGTVHATFRASQVVSWLALIDETGKETTIPQKYCWGFGQIEWIVANARTYRWCRYSRTMVCKVGSTLLIPELVRFEHDIPKLYLDSNQNFSYSFQLSRHLSADMVSLPIVLCTAFIAMWRWSREPMWVRCAGSYLHGICNRWLARNLKTEEIRLVLAQAAENRNVTSTEL